MIGHKLTDPEPVRDTLGRTVFRAACQCMPTGVHYYAARLGDIYDEHQTHLNALRAQSRRNHPSANPTSGNGRAS